MHGNAATKLTNALDQELIEKAIDKSPTGGNAKQFSFKWVDGKLHILHDVELAKHYLNPNHHASWIALGCILVSVEVAAKNQGWAHVAEINKDVGAVISFSPAAESKAPFSSELLLQRTTTRVPFKASAPPTLPGIVEPATAAYLVSAEQVTPSFKKYISMTDKYLWFQRKAMDSFFGEIRFFDHRFSPRGIRSEDLGVNLMDQAILYFFSFVPWLLFVIARIPLLNHTFVSASKRSLKNAHFLLITSKSVDSEGLVRAGQSAMWNWLSLEAQGYRAQPYSVASLSLAAAVTGHLPDDTQEGFKELFQRTGPKELREQFKLGTEEYPVWMLRVGKN